MLAVSRISILILIFIPAMTAAGQNFSATTTVLNTTLVDLIDFSITTGYDVDFLFTMQNTGNTNISAFPEVTVYDSNNNPVITLIYGSAVNMSRWEKKDLNLTWNTVSTGSFTATLTIFYDNNTKTVAASKTFYLLFQSSLESPGSGGGSGGGVISREPYTNIKLWEMREKYLQAEVPESYVLTTPGIVVYEVLTNPEKTYGTMSIKIELLKGLSKIGGVIMPDGDIFEYVNIWFGYEGIRKQDRESIIKFKVDNNWLAGKKIDSSSIKLLRWNENTWISLETVLKGNDGRYTYFEARTDAFGVFAIGNLVSYYETISSVSQADNQSQALSPAAQKEKERLRFRGWSYLIVAFIIIGMLLYMMRQADKIKA